MTKTFKRVLCGALLGTALFLLANTAVWSGATASGDAVPLYHLRNHDSSQYVAFLTLARDHVLFPNLHMAWRTEPAMFNPLFLTSGRIGAWLGMSPVVTLKVLEAVLSIWAGIVLVWVLNIFLETRAQRIGAVIAALFAMPLMMFVLGLARPFLPNIAPLFWLGTIELSYASADGLLRGGLSNGPTLAFGTSMMLAALGLAGARLQTGRRVFSVLLAATTFFSALVHPFEVFVIVPAVAVAYLWLERGAWRELIVIGLGAVLGLSPQLYLLLHHPWMADLSQSFDTDMGFTRLILSYGLGFLAVPYLLFMRALPKSKPAKLLLVWWAVTILVVLLPGAPFPPHLLDGFSMVTGLVIVRLASADPKLQAMFQSHRKALLVTLSCLLIAACASYGAMYVQLAHDGRSLDPQFLLNAVASRDETAVFEEFQKLHRPDDLVLAPDALSMLLVRAPMHSFASHQHLSLDYYRQQTEGTQFFEHKMSQQEADEFLSRYGIHWVVVPDDSRAAEYFAGHAAAFQHGRLRVFELAGNQMKEYPGLAAINPGRLPKAGLVTQVLRFFRGPESARRL